MRKYYIKIQAIMLLHMEILELNVKRTLITCEKQMTAS